MSNRTKRQQYWHTHLEQLAASGLSTKAYAKQRGLKLSTLYAYRKKLRDSKPSVASTQFVRASVAAPSLSCRVHLPNGVIVELGADSHALPSVFSSLASLS